MAKQDQAGDDAPAPTVDELERELKATRERLEAALDANEVEVGDDPDAKLVAALARAQADFPAIHKTKTGEVRGEKNGRSYSYTYAYADLGDVLAAVRPALARYGLAVVQRTTTDNGKVTLITELRHAGGGKLESVVDLGQSSGNPQAFGGALTYLRRYELGTLIGVAPEEDTDARDVPVNTGRQAAPAPELPPWATDLSRERVRDELGPRLKVLLGDDGARAAATTIRNNLGGIPALVSMTTGLILDTILEGAGDAADVEVRLLNEARRRRDLAAAAEVKAAEEAARAEADAAQAAAEAPDPPAPEREADADEPETDAGDAAPVDELPPAGKTPMPDISALDGLEAAAALREAGCICEDPLEATLKESARNDTCPLEGHGIPF